MLSQHSAVVTSMAGKVGMKLNNWWLYNVTGPQSQVMSPFLWISMKLEQ